MASRFNLPHIEITAFVSTSVYVGEAVHGQKIQNELRVALAAADGAKPNDERLEPATGTFVEVELRRGAPADSLDMKKQNIRAGATKTTEANERTIALYVP